MIRVIDAGNKTRNAIPEGRVRNILHPSADGTRVHVAVTEVDPHKTCRVAPADKTQVAYILEGKDVKVTHTSARNTVEHTAQRRAGRLPGTIGGSDVHRR